MVDVVKVSKGKTMSKYEKIEEEVSENLRILLSFFPPMRVKNSKKLR